MTDGQRIKAARKRMGMTQSELAEKLNIPFQSVSQWERDIRKPKLESLQRIAIALDTTVSELVGPGYWSTVSKEEVAESWDGPDIVQATRPSARERVDAALGKLNDDGMEKAADVVEIIAEVPRYRATEDK